jgi:hypothetical protein
MRDTRRHGVIFMPNRREFLQAGLAVSLLPLFPRKVFSPPALKALDVVIFDQRFLKARDFSQQAQDAGLDCAAIEGDITNLYFHDLSLRWNRGPTTIAGLSTKASLFCLEMLARDRGMRLAYMADVLDSEPVPDIPIDIADRRSAAFSIIGEDPGELVVWVIAPREASVREEGEI